MLSAIFKSWSDIHFALLYGFLFSIQIILFVIAGKQKKETLWITLMVVQILSILLVMFGHAGGGILSFPNNLYSSIIALPVYGIFFFASLNIRAHMAEMPHYKSWNAAYKVVSAATFGRHGVTPCTQ